MRLAIITLTEGAYRTAQRVQVSIDIPTDIYTKDSFRGSLRDFVGELFKEYSYLLFIMATGIVVRVIAPYLKDKTIDPGIMVMDEGGDFVISLLSGHLGGANACSQKISKAIGATPVITTASDVLRLPSVDLLARKLHCRMDSLEKAKEITADIVNGKKVGILSDISINIPTYDNIKVIESEDVPNSHSIIYITNKILVHPFPRSIQLIPQNILVGIGCRRGVESKRMIQAINIVFEELGLHRDSLKGLASVDIKKDEVGIREASKYLKVPVDFIDREQIKEVEDRFEVSEFVKKAIGVGAVAQPCGYLISHRGTCLMKKKKLDGIVLSIWEEK